MTMMINDYQFGNLHGVYTHTRQDSASWRLRTEPDDMMTTMTM